MTKIPSTPFDTKIRKARDEAEDQEEEIEDALRRRAEFGREARELIDEAEDRGLDVNPDRLDELRQKRAAAEQDYIRADELRLRARARLTALEAARERYLIQEHNIFPDRRSWRSLLGVREAAETNIEAEGGVPGPGGESAGRAPLPRSAPGHSPPPPPERRLAAGVKENADEPETKDR